MQNIFIKKLIVFVTCAELLKMTKTRKWDMKNELYLADIPFISEKLSDYVMQ